MNYYLLLEGKIDIVFPILMTITKNPVHYIYNKHKKALKSGGKKTDWLGTSGPREKTIASKFPGFGLFVLVLVLVLLCLISPRLGAREPGIPEM